MSKASEIIKKMEEDVDFMKPGRRNDDTVNLLICCYILDKDPDDFVDDHMYTTSCDWSAYLDHKDRIEPYLEDWCPDDNKENGLSYLCQTTYVKEVMQ